MAKFKISVKDEARFWSQVFVRGKNDCWIHTGGTISKDGSGRFHLKGRKIMARRIAFGIQYGYLPACGIKNTCGFLGCLNPAHMEPEIKDKDWVGPSNEVSLL